MLRECTEVKNLRTKGGTFPLLLLFFITTCGFDLLPLKRSYIVHNSNFLFISIKFIFAYKCVLLTSQEKHFNCACNSVQRVSATFFM
jgi:hypothetical protein